MKPAREIPVKKTPPKQAAKAAKATKKTAKVLEKATTTPKPTTGAPHPFPFLGSGVATYPGTAHLVVWFETAPDEDAVHRIVALLPKTFHEGRRVDGPLAIVESGDLGGRGAKRLAEQTRTALLAIHEHAPIRLAIKELAEEGGHELDAWHAWSLGRGKIVASLEEAPLAILPGLAPFLSSYLTGTLRTKARAVLLDRFGAALADARGDGAGGSGARAYVPLYGQLLDELPVGKRGVHVAKLTPRYRLALAVENGSAFDAFVRDGTRAILTGLGRRKDPGVVHDLHAFGRRVVRLATTLEENVVARRTALALAASALDAADACGADEATTNGHRLAIYALQGRLDECVPLLGAVPVDEAANEAVGIALAVATRQSHRPLLDACLALARAHPELLENEITVANLLPELVGTSRFAEATALALEHLSQRRPMTPVLHTNALLAFAYANETGPVATALANDVARRLADGGGYFQGVGPEKVDFRGSAHAWLGLWYARGGDVDRLVTHFQHASELRYADLSVMDKHPAIAPYLGRPEVSRFFQAEADAAIAEKNRLVAKNPRDWWSIFTRGLLFHDKKDFTRAEADYRRTIAIHPAYADVYNNLANIVLERDKDQEGALRWYDESIRRASNLVAARLNRAELRLTMGDAAGALDDVQAVLPENVGHARTRLLAALACDALGDGASARDHAKAGRGLDAAMGSIDVAAWRETLERLAAG